MSRMSPEEIRAAYKGKPNWPMQSFDARDWAQEFITLFGEKPEEIDEALMIGWFANALMRGWDEHAWKAQDA